MSDSPSPAQSRRNGAFRKTDVTRALLVFRKAGIPIARIEIDRDGKVSFVTGDPSDAAAGAGGNEWDSA